MIPFGVLTQQGRVLGDPYWQDVELLLLGNGVDASTTITDSSKNGLTTTVQGTAQIDTAESKFGGSSILFDGTGDGSIYVPYTTEFYWADKNFTFDFWIYPIQSAGTGDNFVWGNLAGSGLPTFYWGFGVDLFDGRVYEVATPSTVFHYSTNSVTFGQWNHVAVTYNAFENKLRMFINGVKGYDATVSWTVGQNSGAPFLLGSHNAQDPQCWIDDFRVTAACRWTSDFDVPTHEARTVAAPAAWQSTLLDDLVSWWSLDETSGTRADSHGSNDLTDVGSTGYTTGVKGNAADFVGINQHLYCVPTGMNTGDNSWSIAGWVRLDELTTQPMDLICALTDASVTTGGSDGMHLSYRYAEQAFDLTVRSNGTRYNVSASTFGTPSIDTWYFVYAYFDSPNNEIGISVNDGTVDTVAYTATPSSKSGSFSIGRWGTTGPYPYWLNGKVDELAFWNRVLTSQEVTDLYHVSSGRAYDELATLRSLPEPVSNIAEWTPAYGYGYFGPDVDGSVNKMTMAYRLYATSYGTYGVTPVNVGYNLFAQHGKSSDVWRIGFGTTYFNESAHPLRGPNILNKNVSVVITVDDTDGNADIHAYWKFDGEIDTGESYVHGMTWPGLATGKVYLGRSNNNGWENYSPLLAGEITDIAVWEDILTPDQIDAYLCGEIPPGDRINSPLDPINDPTDIADLEFWLDASDRGVTANQWDDKSGNGNHFVLSQGTFPTFSNGIADFSSDALQSLKHDYGADPGWSAAEIFVVLKRDAAASSGGADTGNFIGMAGGTDHYLYGGQAYQTFCSNSRKSCGIPSATVTDFHVVNLQSAASHFEFQTDRTTDYSTTSSSVNTAFSSNTFTVGASHPTAGAYYFRGEIKQMILFTRRLTPPEREAVYDWLDSYI
jgi:hypothetical protein